MSVLGRSPRHPAQFQPGPTSRRRRHKGTPIRLYVADLDVRIVTLDGTLLRHLTLDTSRSYQPSGLPRRQPCEGSRVPR
jgi:hypothetical protein